MNTTSVVVSIDLAEADLVHHVAHPDGASSYKVTVDASHVTVYLHGTPEQLGAFADAIVRTASQHAIAELEAANREVNR